MTVSYIGNASTTDLKPNDIFETTDGLKYLVLEIRKIREDRYAILCQRHEDAKAQPFLMRAKSTARFTVVNRD